MKASYLIIIALLSGLNQLQAQSIGRNRIQKMAVITPLDSKPIAKANMRKRYKTGLVSISICPMRQAWPDTPIISIEKMPYTNIEDIISLTAGSYQQRSGGPVQFNGGR